LAVVVEVTMQLQDNLIVVLEELVDQVVEQALKIHLLMLADLQLQDRVIEAEIVQ
jgi:hypothetical protein